MRDRHEVTVNDIASELGLEQSGASRMVASAVGQGHLAARSSSTDPAAGPSR